MNIAKRVGRIERLAKEFGYSVTYPLAGGTPDHIAIHDNKGFVIEAPTLRKTEAMLREWKRHPERAL